VILYNIDIIRFTDKILELGKIMTKIGESITVNSSVRTVVSIKKNTDGFLTVHWESDWGGAKMGVCMPSVWERWKKTGKDTY
jgi:hypothetical protein